ncbi:hypothetical protein ACLF3G_28185 [Falsiroseomonas sp. HC035]|uniref:hypothetical protein n=1 Tax=Falsiroseomonas sp. HC035 TaxID=3390999 RepID=UPI003D317023
MTMPAGTKPTDRPDDALLAEVAKALDQTAIPHRAGASRAACAAAVLRGDAAPVGGEAGRARLAHLALRMLAQPEAAFGPGGVARFLWQQHDHLREAPLDLVRTVAGAEQVRRLGELEPPLGRPDPARVEVAAQLDDLTAEEAFAAYAAGHIGSPQVMAIIGLRSLYGIMTALTQRDLRLPAKPSPVGPGRDDRDLLWENMSRREDPALMAGDAEYYHHRPVPLHGPDLDGAWPSEVPDDAGSLMALDSVAAALDAEVTQQLAQADRAAAAAAGLRGDAAAVGGEEARARLVGWSLLLMRRLEQERAEGTAMILLQPLREAGGPYAFADWGEGALELARTAEGAARVERWLTPDEGTPVIMALGTTLRPGVETEQAFVAYAEGRIDSRRLMEVTGLDRFIDVWGQLYMRGLRLPFAPTPVGSGRDDRDLLWESMTAGGSHPTARPAGPAS